MHCVEFANTRQLNAVVIFAFDRILDQAKLSSLLGLEHLGVTSDDCTEFGNHVRCEYLGVALSHHHVVPMRIVSSSRIRQVLSATI